MSFRNIQKNSVNASHYDTYRQYEKTPVVTAWTRPSDWLSMPSVTSSEQKFVGLYAIYDDYSFVAFSASGAYTVDWGDGTAPQNFASGVQANYKYTYSSISSSTYSTRGYRQVLITVTPQAGQNLTAMNFNLKNTTTNLSAYASGWLDVICSLPNCTAFTFANSTPAVRHSLIERFNGLNFSSLNSFGVLFANCHLLQSVSLDNTGSITSASQMFQNCYNLVEAPLFTTSAVTNMSQMFLNCYNLISVPLYNTASVTNMSSMFNSCYSLISVPAFNTPVLTNVSNMFTSCYSIETIPLFNTASVTNFSSFFSNCFSLETVPLFNMSSAAAVNTMFASCFSLKTVPLFNTASVNAFSNMFQNCYSLESVPLFNMAVVTSTSSMFINCYNLVSVPLFNMASNTDVSSMFSNCQSLTTVPLFNTANVLNMTQFLSGCTSLKTVPLFNTVKVTNMTQMFNGCTSLEEVPLFNTAAVTNMSNMFSTCSSLRAIPTFTTTACTNMSSMFSTATAFQTFPALNTSAVTTVSSMFSGCNSLSYVSAVNFTSCSNFTSAFNQCLSLKKIDATNIKSAITLSTLQLSKEAIESICNNLGTSAGTSISFSSNWGVDTAITKTGIVNTTAQSTTVTLNNTTGLQVGMFVSSGAGAAIATNSTGSSDVTADTITLVGHGLPDGTAIAFTGIGTTTGISTYTVYFVVNATADTFQVALTAGGAAINLTGTNSAAITFRYANYITGIVANTSITLNTPAASTNANATWVFRLLDTSKALLKGWVVAY